MSDFLWLNDAGAILGDTTGTFKPYYDDHCCCAETTDVRECIYARQVAIGMTSGLIDVAGTYTLAELCAEGNKFITYNSRDWNWCLDTTWGAGDTTFPASTTSAYFTTSGPTNPGYVTTEAELIAKVSEFYRVTSPSDAENETGVQMNKYLGSSGSGFATVAEAVAAAKSDFSTTTFKPSAAPTTYTVVYGTGPYSAGVYVNSFEITAALNIVTDYARTISLYLMTETSGDTFASHGQGVTNGAYNVFLSSVKAAAASNVIADPGWTGSPNSPTDFPSSAGWKGWQIDNTITNKACLVIDFVLPCPPQDASV